MSDIPQRIWAIIGLADAVSGGAVWATFGTQGEAENYPGPRMLEMAPRQVVPYVPQGTLAEVWKKAIAIVVGLPVEHYIYSGAHNMDARTFRDNAVKSLEAAMQVEAARDAALSAGKESNDEIHNVK